MSTLMGLLGIEDRKTTVDQIGQKEVFDVINQIAEAHTAEVDEMISAFVEDPGMTDYKEVYYLPGGGTMQDSDEKGGQPGAAKSGGQWDVAYDLRDARDAVGWDDVALAYMTVREVDAHLETITIRHTNWVRYHLLRHLVDKTNASFKDRKRGMLTIKRLINNDGDTIPPLLGSDDEVTNHNHYIYSGYAASAISSTNNPFATMKEHLEEHFDRGTTVAVIHPDQEAKVVAMANFVERTAKNVNPGQDTDTLIPNDFPGVPGELIGTVSDVAVFKWRRWFSGYIMAWDLDAPKPLKQRVDEDVAASLRGFKLVSTDTEFPLTKSTWRDRRGFGVGNRLNGVIMYLDASGPYTSPTGYGS